MKKSIKITVLILLLALFAFGATQLSITEKSNPVTSLRKEIIEVDGGYGYQIYQGDKLLVQQEFIPAVVGRQTFASQQDAQHVADLVMSKITQRTSPMVTLEELTKLDVVILKP